MLDVALKYDATVHDAVHVALSVEHQIPLLTAELPSCPCIKKLRKLGTLPNINPFSFPFALSE